ncbi:hypothetical protein [Bifidobacterium phasiani]|uniref:Uncharacterized protein n=1 Tax=Bifidobacterium phasiani TaxID=2834431 RepID=A0ABS6WBJ8_9BIFI|nr:hypothetical protein [Bifidobacterium phasiani]MBW3083677.1 hypothetical protein [Bifidobacterium phasiani]
MANEDLRAEVRRLQSHLNDIERENGRLRGEIGAGVGAMMQANKSLNDTSTMVRNRLGAADGTLGRAHRQVIAAYEVQRDMDALYGRLKQMELANKRIRECNNKKFYDFAVYRQVRRIVQGIMDNLDFSMVTDEVIDKAIERNHLENPDYWLTCVLMAVVAWHSDQRERSQRALDKAMALDDRKTASFLMVFYLRLHREETALHWFSYLTAGQLKGAEKPMVLLFFSMLSKTIEDRLSDKARTAISDYIYGLIDDEIEHAGEGRVRVVERITEAFVSFVDDRQFGYESIRRYVPGSGALAESLARARNNANIIDFIAQTMNVDEASRNEFLKSYVDDIVAAPCPAEKDVYDEIDRNEFIIKYQGDVDAAQAAYQERKQHDDSDFDIIAEMIDWIYTPSGRSETNPQMRRNMLLATKRLQQEAGDLYVRQYRGMCRPVQRIVIDDFSITADLREPDKSSKEAQRFYEGRAAEEKAAIKDVWAIVLMVIGVVGGIALAVFLIPSAICLGVLAAAVGGVWMLMNRASRRRIDLKYQQIIRTTRDRLAELSEDWHRFEQDFHEQDLLSQQLSDRLAAL